MRHLFVIGQMDDLPPNAQSSAQETEFFSKTRFLSVREQLLLQK